MRGDARLNLEILGRLGVTVVEIADSQAWELHFSEVRDCTLIVDAIFGTGLKTAVSGLIESVIADVNASDIPVVAVDLPSGLSADSADPIGPSIEAALTITLSAPKIPLVLPPAELRAVLTRSARVISVRPKDEQTGSGLVDPVQALQLLLPGPRVETAPAGGSVR